MIIQCRDEHILSTASMINESNSRHGSMTPINNGILDVVRNELKLDHFYVVN